MPKFSQCIDFPVFLRIFFPSSTLMFCKPHLLLPSGSPLVDSSMYFWQVTYLKTILLTFPHLVKDQGRDYSHCHSVLQ